MTKEIILDDNDLDVDLVSYNTRYRPIVIEDDENEIQKTKRKREGIGENNVSIINKENNKKNGDKYEKKTDNIDKIKVKKKKYLMMMR
jgi:hypothetical protein